LLAGCAGASSGTKTAPPVSPPTPARLSPPMTVTTPAGTSNGPTTEAALAKRVEQMLRGIPIGAQVPRVALADVVYPRSREEFKAMNGWTLLLVCSFARDNRELPVARVVARAGTASADLPLVARQQTRVPTGAVADMLGTRRIDEVYLLPVLVTAVDATVTVHFPVSGRALDIFQFPAPADSLPAGVDVRIEVHDPEMDALEKLIREELPVIRPGAMLPPPP